MYFLSNIANEMSFYQVGLILKYTFSIIFTVIPIIVMIMCMIDLSKHITKPDNYGPTIKIMVSRLIAGLIIFLLPTLISTVFSLIENYDDSSITKYYTDASVEKIEQLKSELSAEFAAEKNKTTAELKQAGIEREEAERKRVEQLEEFEREEENTNTGGGN